MEYLNRYIMIRYGELNTKGRNKKDFVMALKTNVKAVIKDNEAIIRYDHDYLFVNPKDDHLIPELISRIKKIPGVYSFSLVYKINHDLQSIVDSCYDLALEADKKTFKVKSKRSDKRYPHRSEEIIRAVAAKILKNTDCKVDVKNPELLLTIEIRNEGVFVYNNSFKGMGGYPNGTLGRATMMISGGIDSPVAAYLLIKRGIRLEFIHFASPPYTQYAVIEKIKDILKILKQYQPYIKLHIIPFTEIQKAIYDNVPEEFCITMMRRRMYEIANEFSKRRDLVAICNGESIGQVASQTLASIHTITHDIDLPIIRPLSVVDKLDIIKIAEEIGTYEISIRPYEDCCTIFTPRNPKTAPKIEHISKYEQDYDYKPLVETALANVETIHIRDDEFTI